MALKARDLDQLIARLGKDNVLHSQADRIVYSTDVGSPPGIVDLLLPGGRLADAVARCHSVDDVETVVQFCLKRGIPMTPRGAATNALGGATPKRAGIVIDMTPMRKGLQVDEGKMQCTVNAGMVIGDLRDKLQEVGLDLPCYPTSALAATIGGFVAMDGHGLGSTANGNIGKHVVAVEGVGADGHRFLCRDLDEIQFYVGLGGSTGVITSITLGLVEATKDKPVLVAMPQWRDVEAFIQEARAKFPLKHIMFRGRDFFALRAEATGVRKNPLGARHGVMLVFAEKDHNAHAEALGRMVERLGGEVLADKVATAEWDERFFPIKAKKLGPSLVAGETMVPVEKMALYLRRVKERISVNELSVEGHVTDDGQVYFFLFTLDDERRPQYPLGWSTSAWILGLAKKFGGRSYQSGVWLQFESKSVFGATRYNKLKAFKVQADHRNLMNPGTMFPMVAPVPEKLRWMENAAPVPIGPSLGFQLWAGNPMLQSMGWFGKHRRQKTLGVQAADVAGDMAWGGDMAVHSDIIWGADIPSLQAIPNPGDLPMTQTPRGKMVLAKAFVQGKIADPWNLKQALDIADPSDDEAKVCWQWDDVKKVLDSFRRTISAEGVELEVKAVEIKEAPSEAAPVAAAAGEPTKDYEAIRAQAKATPEPEKAWVLAADCIVCNGCEAACPTDAAIVTDTARVDRDLCIADGACFDACPTGAIRPGIEDESTSAGWPEGSRLAGKFGV